jgi:outer membrane protein insertion porin family
MNHPPRVMPGGIARGLVLCLLAVLWPGLAGAVTVHQIRVENLGSDPIDEPSVLSFTRVRVGDEFNRTAVNRDVKALEKSGRYSFVSAHGEMTPDGVVVVYRVQTRPRLAGPVRVVGGKYYDASKIRKWMAVEPGDPIDDAILAVATQKAAVEYRKSYFPDVAFAWDIEPGDEPGTASATVRVTEGRRAKIRRIDFTGNDAVSRKTLRKTMKQRPINFFSWLTKAGRFSPDELETDREALRLLYLNKGFLDAHVEEPDVQPVGRNGVTIRVPIREGRPYRVGHVAVEGVTLFPPAEVASQVELKPGDLASMQSIERSGQNIKDFYGSRGYIRTYVRNRLSADPETGQVRIEYRVTEGKLAYIRNVRISGNHKTKDKVIRREMIVYPGDVYNEPRVKRSERRVFNLGYFESVYSLPEETPEPTEYDVHLQVAEKKTGQLVVGAGFSSVDNLVGFVELSQGNFDIKGWPYFTGGGQKLKLRAQLGSSRRDAEITFIEPWFLDRRLEFSTSLFTHDRGYLSDEYDQRNTGGSVSLGKPLDGFNRVRLTYSLQEYKIYDVDEDASQTIKDEEGSRIKSAMTLELIHNSRDRSYAPTRGTKASVGVTLAGGPLAGETDLYSLEGNVSHLIPLWFSHIFSLRGQVAVVDEYGDADRVPIFDRLFLGGARSLRGFKYRDVGPKDEFGEPIGGKSSIFGSAEYTVPLAARVRLAVFYDIGMVYEDAYEFDLGDYNSDFGFGVRFDIPQFPLHLDYAWPLEADEFNDRSSGRFNFLLGYLF